MIIKSQEYIRNGLAYKVRSATAEDADQLSALRLKIDGETEYLDRVQGEGYIDGEGFRRLIEGDSNHPRNLFLVAEAGIEAEGSLIGFARCQGSDLQRITHKVEFGICILQEFWGYGVGPRLLEHATAWADANGLKKISLQVLETNDKAVQLYKRYGFEVEGLLQRDKMLSDGRYYSTIVMGRHKD